MAEILETIAPVRQPLSHRSRQADLQLSWVIASQDGDTVAFNRLVLKWQQTVYNLCLRMLRDPDDAAEVAQETFMSAYKSIRRFRLESQFSTWLYRIASNQCLTRLRKRPSLAHQSLDEPTDEGFTMADRLASFDDHEEDVYRTEKQHYIRMALGAIPVDQRITVELKFFQEQTFEEIASILNVPLSTVKSRFYAGLRGLKQRLAAPLRR